MTIATRHRYRHNDGKRDAGRFICLDCQNDVLRAGEYYMLRDLVWLAANPRRQGMLCIGCVEKRLGRRLAPEDFQGAPLDHHLINGLALSKRLMRELAARKIN
jgi:hypothetical protein